MGEKGVVTNDGPTQANKKNKKKWVLFVGCSPSSITNRSMRVKGDFASDLVKLIIIL